MLADDVARRWNRHHHVQLDTWGWMALLAVQPFDAEVVEECLAQSNGDDRRTAMEFVRCLALRQRSARRTAA